MNETFVVGSEYDCSLIESNSQYKLEKQMVFGCRVLNLLQEMLHFNVSYSMINETSDLAAAVDIYKNLSVDIFVRPMSLKSDVIKLVYPVQYLFDFSFGFTIYRRDVFTSDSQFFLKPFSHRLWHCLYGMALFCSVLFYILKLWEIRLVKGPHWEQSYVYEMLMVAGAYCQHIPPIDAVLFSRRGAYFAFFMFSYLIYTYYTSNLLSHIVNDKDADIDVASVLESDLEGVIVKDVEWIIKKNLNISHDGKLKELLNKVYAMRTVTILEGLEALKTGTVALLSDYVTVEPFVRLVFESHEICDLTNVVVCSTLKRYFYVALDFPYKEEFKISFLRMKETGVMNKLTLDYKNVYSECVSLPHVQAQFSQIVLPICLLLGTYGLSVILLVGEILMYNHSRIRLWPYIE